jgi:hypothetical protein
MCSWAPVSRTHVQHLYIEAVEDLEIKSYKCTTKITESVVASTAVIAPMSLLLTK